LGVKGIPENQMGKRGAPLGNKNAAGGRMVTDAIRKAAIQGNYELLHKAANAVMNKAAEGDIAAFSFVADRLEGKPAQQIALTGEDGGPVRVAQVVWADE
jgi:hypothetical protein